VADLSGSKYSVQVKHVTVDVCKPEARPAALSQIESMTKKLDLGVLGMLPKPESR